MDRSHAIFHYHFYTARDALKGLLDDTDPTGVRNMKAVFGISDRSELNVAYTVSEANLIACMHTLRGSIDIFSHLINGLLLRGSIAKRNCDIFKVQQALPPSELKDEIGALLASHWFGYVAAFINTTKHRQLVEHAVSVSFEENRAGVRLGKFEYEGTSYPQYWGHEVLAGVADVKNGLLGCGRVLNRVCVG